MDLELRLEQALDQVGGREMGACVWHPAGNRGGGFWACPCGWTSKVVRRGLGIAEEEAAVRHATRCDENWPARKPSGKRRRAVAPKVGPRGGRTEIQALLFPRKLWSNFRISNWLERNGYPWDLKIHPTEQYFRVRIVDPDSFKRMRTKCLMRRKGKCVIKAVIGVR